MSPKTFARKLYTEDQQHLNRKRKRRDSDSSPSDHTPMIINNYIPVHPGQGLINSSKTSTDNVNISYIAFYLWIKQFFCGKPGSNVESLAPRLATMGDNCPP